MALWTRRFKGGELAARNARHAVREALGDTLPEPRLGDVELMVSELATNSVRHAGCDDYREFSMAAHVRGDRVRLRLCDEGDGFEEAPVPSAPDEAGGFGLMLLDRLSDRWGVQRNGGFCVWFEVARG